VPDLAAGLDLRRLPRAALVALGGSALLNAGLLGLARSQGIALRLPAPAGSLPLTLPLTLGITVALVGLATLLLLLCVRFSRQPLAAFRVALFGLLVVALAGPLSQPDLDRPAKAILNSMQVATLLICLRSYGLLGRHHDTV